MEHTTDWKLGYAEQALKSILEKASQGEITMHPEAYMIRQIARKALEEIK